MYTFNTQDTKTKNLKRISLILVIAAFFFSCKADKEQQASVAALQTSESGIPVYDFAGFEPLINKDDGKTYIVNFWATWCKPCIEELPAFEAVNTKYGDKGVEVVLVSLDFSDKLESKVVPFVKKHGLKSDIVLLDDVDSNTWIPKVSEDWSGAIPATLIYNKKGRKFYEGSFTYEELETELKTFLQ